MMCKQLIFCVKAATRLVYDGTDNDHQGNYKGNIFIPQLKNQLTPVSLIKITCLLDFLSEIHLTVSTSKEDSKHVIVIRV